MKRIIYQVVVAKTAEDNENWNYWYAFRSAKEQEADKFATDIRKESPEYAFIVLEERHEHKDFGMWEIDHNGGGEKVLEHY